MRKVSKNKDICVDHKKKNENKVNKFNNTGLKIKTLTIEWDKQE